MSCTEMTLSALNAPSSSVVPSDKVPIVDPKNPNETLLPSLSSTPSHVSCPPLPSISSLELCELGQNKGANLSARSLTYQIVRSQGLLTRMISRCFWSNMSVKGKASSATRSSQAVSSKLSVLNVLKDVDVCVRSGQLVGVMGPSGAGKTTLLNALSGRTAVPRERRVYESGSAASKDRIVSGAHLYGTVWCNGLLMSDSVLRRSNSYVMQNDLLLESLTVRETFQLAASFKMKRLNRQQRIEIVDKVISDLGLYRVRNSTIGGPNTRKGISGGEMKRVSIGVELLTSPELLFLDEPTSGLDSSLAFDVLCLLRNLAHGENRTVVCTIHQPRSQMFELFDHLILLSRGEVVYQGPVNEVVPYFSRLGYVCPERLNPADFVLDLLSADNTMVDKQVCGHPLRNATPVETSTLAYGSNSVGVPVNRSAQIELDLRDDIEVVVQHECRTIARVHITEKEVQRLPELFRASGLCEAGKQWNCHGNHSHDSDGMVDGYDPELRPLTVCSLLTGWLRDTQLIAWRSFLQWWRDPRSGFLGSSMFYLVLGLVLGGLWFQLSKTSGQETDVVSVYFSGGITGVKEATKQQLSDFRNVIGALFFSSVLLAFASLSSLSSFQQQCLLFNRESASGLYGAGSFFIGKSTSDALFQHIPPCFFLLTFYFMSGLSVTPFKVPMYLLISHLILFASCGLCYLLGSAISSQPVTMVAAPLCIVIMMLMAGYFISVRDLPPWCGWLQWLSLIKYAYIAYCVNELPPGENWGILKNEDWLEGLGVPQSEQKLVFNVVALFIWGVICRILAYLALRFLNRKQGLEG